MMTSVGSIHVTYVDWIWYLNVISVVGGCKCNNDTQQNLHNIYSAFSHLSVFSPFFWSSRLILLNDPGFRSSVLFCVTHGGGAFSNSNSKPPKNYGPWIIYLASMKINLDWQWHSYLLWCNVMVLMHALRIRKWALHACHRVNCSFSFFKAKEKESKAPATKILLSNYPLLYQHHYQISVPYKNT